MANNLKMEKRPRSGQTFVKRDRWK